MVAGIQHWLSVTVGCFRVRAGRMCCTNWTITSCVDTSTLTRPRPPPKVSHPSTILLIPQFPPQKITPPQQHRKQHQKPCMMMQYASPSWNSRQAASFLLKTSCILQVQYPVHIICIVFVCFFCRSCLFVVAGFCGGFCFCFWLLFFGGGIVPSTYDWCGGGFLFKNRHFIPLWYILKPVTGSWCNRLRLLNYHEGRSQWRE